MPNNHRARVLIFATFILFLCLLVWNLGADISPVAAFQDLDPFTPTISQTDAAPLPDNIHTETPAPTENPTDSSILASRIQPARLPRRVKVTHLSQSVYPCQLFLGPGRTRKTSWLSVSNHRPTEPELTNASRVSMFKSGQKSKNCIRSF
jgi:hypothetical protein